MDEKSLSHPKWNCKYYIVLVPKYRRKVIYKRLRKDIGKILRRLCEYKHVEIVEAHAMPDHIHMCPLFYFVLLQSGFSCKEIRFPFFCNFFSFFLQGYTGVAPLTLRHSC